MTTAVLLLLTVVPAISLAPDVPDLPEVAPSAAARNVWNVSDATAPVTENLTTTASHCGGYFAFQPDPKDPGGTAGDVAGAGTTVAQCEVDHIRDLIPTVPCVDAPCPPTDPCEYVDCDTDPCNKIGCRILPGGGGVPNPCNYIDCRIIDGFLNGGGGGDFEANENKVCDAGDPHWFSDQDGDGEIDCFDNDNDGDLLTDELEYKTSPYDMNNPFTDGVIRDDWDIAPSTTDLELAGINVPTIDMGDSGCDGLGGEPADPYIRRENGATTIRVRYGSNSSTGFTTESETPLKEPWTKDDHLDSHDGEIGKEPFDPGWTLDGQSDADVGPGAFDNHRYSLPHNVSAFGVDQASEEPAIQLTFGLRDHDHTLSGDEEHIDLGDGAPLDAALSYELRGDGSLDKPVPKVTEGDATCFAKIVGAFDDIVPETTNDIAVYRAANPHKMIYTDTV